MTGERLPTAWMTLAVLVAVVLAATCTWALTALARPDDLLGRQTRLAQRVDAIERLAKAPAGSEVFAPQAICAHPDDASLSAIRADLTALASQTRLPISTLSLSPLAQDRSGVLTPIRVDMEAEGSYEAVLTWLDQLQGRRGEVFIDSLDLTSRVATVHLKLRGKVFCWTAA